MSVCVSVCVWTFFVCSCVPARRLAGAGAQATAIAPCGPRHGRGRLARGAIGEASDKWTSRGVRGGRAAGPCAPSDTCGQSWARKAANKFNFLLSKFETALQCTLQYGYTTVRRDPLLRSLPLRYTPSPRKSVSYYPSSLLRPVSPPAVLERARTFTDSLTACVLLQWTTKTRCEKTSARRVALRPRSDLIFAIPRQRLHVSPPARQPRRPRPLHVYPSPATHPRPPHVYPPRPSHVYHVCYYRLRPRPRHVCHVYRRRRSPPSARYVCHVRSSARARLHCQLSHLCCAVYRCTRATFAISIARARYCGTGMRIARGT